MNQYHLTNRSPVGVHTHQQSCGMKRPYNTVKLCDSLEELHQGSPDWCWEYVPQLTEDNSALLAVLHHRGQDSHCRTEYHRSSNWWLSLLQSPLHLQKQQNEMKAYTQFSSTSPLHVLTPSWVTSKVVVVVAVIAVVVVVVAAAAAAAAVVVVAAAAAVVVVAAAAAVVVVVAAAAAVVTVAVIVACACCSCLPSVKFPVTEIGPLFGGSGLILTELVMILAWSPGLPGW